MRLLEEGQTVRDTYEGERFLGEGAFAEVYRVKHRFLGRQAMKVFKRVGMNLDEIQDMLGEAILLTHLKHPNIISVSDANVFETRGGTCGYFTMEHVPGGSLDKFWRSHGGQFVPVETAIDLIKQVCRGIAQAHRENPRQVTGKLYVLTLRGRRVIHEAFGLQVPAEAKGLDWRKYARAVRAKARSAVLLEVGMAESSGPATATQIRKSLHVKRPFGLNPVIRALKELEGLGLVKSARMINGDTRTFYRLTRPGAAIVQQLKR